MERRLGYRPLSGEASPYYIWDPRLAPRIRATVPDVKAILLLRDPVERAWSHYWERRAMGVEPLTFEEALAAEDDRTAGELARMMADPGYHSDAYDFYSYRQRGIYLPQIENWLQHFSRDQLLILVSEEMYAEPQGTFDQVCDFLGLPHAALPGGTKKFNSLQQGAMDPRVRARLADEFADANADLEKFLGRGLGWC